MSNARIALRQAIVWLLVWKLKALRPLGAVPAV